MDVGAWANVAVSERIDAAVQEHWERVPGGSGVRGEKVWVVICVILLRGEDGQVSRVI